MPCLEILPAVMEDFDRFLDHMLAHDVADAAQRIGEIVNALDLLVAHPLIGRPVAHDHRELVLGRGTRGYVALYQYLPELDTVFILAIRSQREAGYAR